MKYATPQLPVAPSGYEYRFRTIGQDHYLTTGLFPVGSPDGTLSHLALAPCLILDCDASEFIAASARQPPEQIKKQLHELTTPMLDSVIDSLIQYASARVAELIGEYPTAVVASGYGAHLYLWLAANEWQEISRVRAANALLMHSLNRLAGFALADPQAHDAGTRILRPVGSLNRKNKALPRPVRLVWCEPARLHSLARVEALKGAYGHPSAAFASSAAASSKTPFFASNEARQVAADRSASRGAAKATAITPEELSNYLATNETDAREVLHLLFNDCPFFRWAQENAATINREAWRGAATNIAAVAGELGRDDWHIFSRLDLTRYDSYTADSVYTDAIKSAETHGPMTYAALQAAGYPGTAPPGLKAPASIRFSGKTVAATREQPGITLDHKTGLVKKTAGNVRKLLRADSRFGNRLRYNEMRLQIEHDGSAKADAFFGEVAEYLEDSYKVPFPRAMIEESVIEVAQENGYHPVKNYLKGLSWDGKPRINTLITDVLKCEPNTLYFQYMRCFLIGAVARALCDNPEGVKVDTALILKGEQGVGKSSFFRILSEPFFCDTRVDLNSKDAYTTLRSAWLVEWQEFENALTRHAYGIVKAFLSAQLDTYRGVYERTTQRQPRRCVIVGTTNEDHFLNDPTGSRRFWVIEVPGDANLSLLKEIKDQIWAEAVEAYRKGEQWYLEKAQELARQEIAIRYAQDEPWESLVTRWVIQKQIVETTTEQILSDVVLKEPKDWRKADTQIIGTILRKLGFHRYRVTTNGEREYRYRRLAPLEAGQGAQRAAESSGAQLALVIPFPEINQAFSRG